MTRLAMAALSVLLTGCPPRPEVRPVEQPASMTPWIPVVEWFETHQGPEDCPPDKLVSDLVQGAIGIEEDRLNCLLDLAKSRELSGVDSQVASGEMAKKDSRIDSLENQRWYFAGGAAVLTLVLTLLLGSAI